MDGGSTIPEAGWLRRGAIYQVYPRSFQDTDGDGVGDLDGVRRRLRYLRVLGIDAVWLSPFYRSPMADFGYDVSDHCAVDPRFGTLADFDALAEEARRLGLRLILDFVPNHTSIEHPWFRDPAKRDWYLWHEGDAGRAAEQLGEQLRRLRLGVGRRARRLVLPRLPARAARPELAQPGGPRGDARRAALLGRPRRRRLPRRRAAPVHQGRPAGATTRRTPTGARATTRTRR